MKLSLHRIVGSLAVAAATALLPANAVQAENTAPFLVFNPAGNQYLISQETGLGDGESHVSIRSRIQIFNVVDRPFLFGLTSGTGSTNEYQLQLWIQEGDFWVGIADNDIVDRFPTGVTASDYFGEWHDYELTYDGGDVSLSIDGEEVWSYWSFGSTLAARDWPLQISSRNEGYVLGRRTLDGAVAYLVMEIDGEEAVRWNLDEGEGDLANDSSGNERHGDIVEATWGGVGGFLPFEARFGSVRFLETIPEATFPLASFSLEPVNEGDSVYVDTDDTIVSLPAALAGNLAIKTEGDLDEEAEATLLLNPDQNDHIRSLTTGHTDGADQVTLRSRLHLLGLGDDRQFLFGTTAGTGSTNEYQLQIWEQNGEFRIGIADDAGEQRPYTGIDAEPYLDAWHVYEVTYDAGNVSFSIDGDELWTFDTGGSNLADRDFPLQISTRNEGYAVGYRTLNAMVANMLMEIDGDEVIRWNLDEGSGTVAHDATGNGNDGEIVGPVWSADGNRPPHGIAPYLAFAADRPLTVYLAYDETATVPPWVENAFTPTGMQVETTAGNFDVWSREAGAQHQIGLLFDTDVWTPEDNNYWVILSEGPDAITELPTGVFHLPIPGEDWVTRPYFTRLETDPGNEPHQATLITGIEDLDPESGFRMTSEFQVPQLAHPGENAYGLALLGNNNAFVRGEWLPSLADGNSVLRLVDTDGTVLAEETWTGLRPRFSHPFVTLEDIQSSNGAEFERLGTLDSSLVDTSYFLDEDFEITSMPDILARRGWLAGIRTANADVGETSTSYLQFTPQPDTENLPGGFPPSESVTVFVAWDIRAVGHEPNWLKDDFVLTHHMVRVDSNAGAHRLWKSRDDYPVGETVTLGGASAEGNSIPTGTNNYFVLAMDSRGALDETYEIEATGIRHDGVWDINLTLRDAAGESLTVGHELEESLDGHNDFGIIVHHPDIDAPGIAEEDRLVPVWDTFRLTMEGAVGPALVTFNEWAAEYGLTGDDADPAASPAGDGVANLVKFALGLDPTVTAAGSDLPQPALDDEHGLTFTYTEYGDVEVTYIPEASTDLLTWSAADVTEVSRQASGDGESVTVRTTLEGDRVFLRLRVE